MMQGRMVLFDKKHRQAEQAHDQQEQENAAVEQVKSSVYFGGEGQALPKNTPQ